MYVEMSSSKGEYSTFFALSVHRRRSILQTSSRQFFETSEPYEPIYRALKSDGKMSGIASLSRDDMKPIRNGRRRSEDEREREKRSDRPTDDRHFASLLGWKPKAYKTHLVLLPKGLKNQPKIKSNFFFLSLSFCIYLELELLLQFS